MSINEQKNNITLQELNSLPLKRKKISPKIEASDPDNYNVIMNYGESIIKKKDLYDKSMTIEEIISNPILNGNFEENKSKRKTKKIKKPSEKKNLKNDNDILTKNETINSNSNSLVLVNGKIQIKSEIIENQVPEKVEISKIKKVTSASFKNRNQSIK